MQPDYQNWVPKGMCIGLWCGSILAMILFIIFGVLSIGVSGTFHTVLFILTLLLMIGLFIPAIYMQILHQAFDYHGKRKLSKTIIEGITEYVKAPENGKVLDIGCGSGALTIAVAKKNPNALVTGLDRWGKEYASYSKALCESNAKLEGVSNIYFVQGDATKLPFEDNYFDTIISNYCIHNIPSKNRQEILKEALRTLKKGGTFAIHDIYSKGKYGDMDLFIKELKEEGYEKVELIWTKDKFMKPGEAKFLSLADSALLIGKK